MQAAGQGIGLIADDLTGACDASLPFFRCGARVALQACDGEKNTPLLCDEWAWNSNEAQLLAINIASRHAAVESLEETMALAVGRLKNYGLERVYLKIDSTLRGPVGAFCWAAAQALQADLVVIAPALPNSQRQTVGGYQLVAGEPVERSSAGRDSRTPVSQSHVPTLLVETLPEALKLKASDLIGHVPLSVVIRGAAPILAALQAAAKEGKRLVVVDATSDIDLEQLALALEKASLKLTVVPCGSAGLANVLAPRWVAVDEDIADNTAKAANGFLHGSRCIGVMGSNTTLSHEQLEALQSLEGVVRLPLSPEMILGLEPLDALLEHIQTAWEQERIPVVTTAWPQGVVTHTLALATEHQLSPQAVYYRLNHTLSQLAKTVTDHHGMLQTSDNPVPLTWWASGGDTAEAIAAGIQLSGNQPSLLAWQLVKETRTGFPVLASQVSGFAPQGAEPVLPVRLITRSGNYGISTTLHAFLSRWLLEASSEVQTILGCSLPKQNTLTKA
ncbi:MAG: four-carbon acid sugar kinase family protein [Vampirovibrionales bacterium]|nr:four-carbon acid sugar kinase family protein [Vampirovibrionales bacterium]